MPSTCDGTFDTRGRLWVVQYLQYPEPAGIKAISRDNYWRVVYDRLPEPPGKGVPGKDTVSVFQPTGNTYSAKADFVSGLNIATAVAPDLDGVWVLNPPYLLYYADRNHDVIPDGPPEIHLEGFGIEDTHSVVNSLCFGPDGWLYAAQGSTVSGSVKRYGTEQKPIKSMGQLIWRYHPRLHRYEVFAEGGGNAFGVAFDDQGRIFSGHNGGDTRGFHYEQGGYYRKGFGKHGELSNPFAFGYLMPMQHDPIQRFTHTMLICQGTALQSDASDSMLAVDPLHGTLVETRLHPVGSTYRTEDVAIAVQSRDKWFRPVAIIDGPDGAAYVCDWYDSQVAHIYAHEGKLDRDHGRLYRFGPPSIMAPEWDVKLANGIGRPSLEYLLQTLKHPYRWQRWSARRLLAAHPFREQARSTLMTYLKDEGQLALEALWTLHACGWLSDTLESSEDDSSLVEISSLFQHPNPQVRKWAIRLACDDQQLNPSTKDALILMLSLPQSDEVLVQIAASIRRLDAATALSVSESMFASLSGSDDKALPLMMWWMVEKHADSPALLMHYLNSSNRIWKSDLFGQEIAPRLLRRSLSLGTEDQMAYAATLLEEVRRVDSQLQTKFAKELLAAFEKAYEGRSLAGVPNELIDAVASLGPPSLTLKLRRGDQDASIEAIGLIRDPKKSINEKTQLLAILGEVPNPSVAEQILDLAMDRSLKDEVRSAAIRTLSSYPQTNFANRLLLMWQDLSPQLRSTTISTLVSRASWSNQLLQAIEENRIQPSDVALESIRAMRFHMDDKLQARLSKLFPDSPKVDLQAAQEQVAKISRVIESTYGDPYRGKKLYTESCGRCHKLFGTGGDLGPDLTGYQRDQLQTLTMNIVAPDLEIREGFQAFAVLTSDDEVLTGFIERETNVDLVVRVIDGHQHLVTKSDIEQRKPLANSLMPQGLLDKYSEQDLADLFAYLRSSQPLND